MKKVIIISNLLTLFLLGYYAVEKGIDLLIGAALIVSVISNVLNLLSGVEHGREEK
jgi:hypothetical protein